LIKVVNLVSVIIAPIIVQYSHLGIGGWVAVAVLVAALAWSVWQSKRSSAEPLVQETPQPRGGWRPADSQPARIPAPIAVPVPIESRTEPTEYRPSWPDSPMARVSRRSKESDRRNPPSEDKS
jgi:hypothetical protein